MVNWVGKGNASVSYNTSEVAGGMTGTYKLSSVGVIGIGDIYDLVTGHSASQSLVQAFYIKPVSISGNVIATNPSNPQKGYWVVDLDGLSADYNLVHKSHSAVTVVYPFIADSSGTAGLQFSSWGDDIEFFASYPNLESSATTTSVPSGVTVFPGTNRRFAPTILLTGQGGTTPSGWNSLWNTWCEPYYQNWIDPSEGVKMGLYHPAYALKNFYTGSQAPSNGTNPNDPAYDWSHFDAQLACQPIAQGKAKFHFMIDVEGSTIPAWMVNAGYVHYPPGQKEVVDYTNSGLVNAYKDFWTAFAARYNDDIRVFTILIDEDNSNGGVDENVWQAGKTEVYTHCVTVCSKMTVIVTMNPAIIEDLCVDTEIGPGVSDIKMFGFECGAQNFPSAGGYSCTLEPARACERHNSVLSSPPRPPRPTCLLSISNGYRIVGGSDGWNPPNLINPWGELLPTPLEPPANADTNVTPAIYAWYISYHPRSSNDDSNLGQNGRDPQGIIPSNYFCIATTGIRHEGETPQDWNRALTLFGAQGTKAVPAIPYGFDPGGGGGGGEISSTSSTSTTTWLPSISDSWFIQLDTSSGLDMNVDVDIYDIDIFDTSTAVVSTLHSQGKKVIGYFSAGSYENWRPDEGDFPPSVLGNNLDDWPGERWLDVRNISALRPIMQARMDLAVAKGFDGVDPDNVDGYSNNTGFAITAGHQISYNQMLAQEAHSRGLVVGLKNDPDQVATLVNSFDFSINEEAFFYNEETKYLPFINQGKPVFNIEYQEKRCADAQALGYYHVLKNLSLDAFRDTCEGGVTPTPSQGSVVFDGSNSNGPLPATKTVEMNVFGGINKLLLVGVTTEVTNPTISAYLNAVEMWKVADVDNGWNAGAIFGAWDASFTYGLNTIEAVTNDVTAGTNIVATLWSSVKQDYIRDTASAFAATNSAVSSLTNAMTVESGGVGFYIAAHERGGRSIVFNGGATPLNSFNLESYTSNSGYNVFSSSGSSVEVAQAIGSADSMIFVSAAFDPDPVTAATATIVRQSLHITGNVFTTNVVTGTSFIVGDYAPEGNVFTAYADAQAVASFSGNALQLVGNVFSPKNKIVVEFLSSYISPVGSLFTAYDRDQIAYFKNSNFSVNGNVFNVLTRGGWSSNADRSNDPWIKLEDR